MKKILTVTIIPILICMFFVSSTFMYNIYSYKKGFNNVYELVSSLDSLDVNSLPNGLVLVDKSMISWDSLRYKISECDCSYEIEWKTVTPKNVKGGIIEKIIYSPLYLVKARPVLKPDDEVFSNPEKYLKCRVLGT